jgi:type 1 glutamine amidotransferase
VRLRAFVTFGGWEEHDPEGCATWVAELLRLHGFDVELADTLAPAIHGICKGNPE